MKIKYLGHSSFKIEGKGTTGESVTVITDPFDKSVGFPYPSDQTADILTISHQHSDHNATKKELLTIDTPGEYEIKGLRIFGIKSFHDDKNGAERGPNTMFVYDFVESR